MLRAILEALKGRDDIAVLVDEFSGMLELASQILHAASDAYFSPLDSTVDREAFRAQDVKINKLERKIRKRLLWLLMEQDDARNAPTGLLLMSLVKDAERIGDYAKDIAMLSTFAGGAAQADPAVLRGIATEVGDMVNALPRVFRDSDRTVAAQLVRQGRSLSDRCEDHLKRIASGPTFAGLASHLLATQYYLRTLGHAMNILSGLVNPLHKVDYHDDKDMLAEVQFEEQN